MTIVSVVSAVETAIEAVAGLRVQTSAGKVNPPAAVIEHDSVQGPSAFDGSADHVVRVALLVQLGEFRNSIDRTYELADEVIDALLADGLMGPYRLDFGTLEYGGVSYAGAVLAVVVTE